MNNKRIDPTWIWYPGDFEIWLGNRFNNRRTERGAMFPPFWKQDSHWPTVEFRTEVNSDIAETISIYAEGTYNVMLDGKLLFGMPTCIEIPAGLHTISIKVHNTVSPPSLFIDGPTITSGDGWVVTYEDKIWIDENGVAHGCGIYQPAAKWNFNNRTKGPSTYSLLRKRLRSVKTTPLQSNLLYDFGKEMMGFPILTNIQGEGEVSMYYGESREEALDKDHCETLDKISISKDKIIDLSSNRSEVRKADYALAVSKAFRFILLETTGALTIGDTAIDYEYSPFDTTKSGRFKCNDDELNRIWQVSAYTMDLTTREFFMDGIKRDRWTWSGDAIQSYLMNYYLRFDTECVKRTIRQLRGKDPVTSHINTIMDYTFYWFKSIHDYWLYTGDIDFIREMYPLMRSLMRYCEGRTDVNGMAEGKPDDWIFVDWTDFPMHKRGVLCFEQMLYTKAVEVMGECAILLRDNQPDNLPQGSISVEEYDADANRYTSLYCALRRQLRETFWSEDRHAWLHALEEGKMNDMVTKFPNMFAILYGYSNGDERERICQDVLQDEKIDKITTPYMRFYELEAFCLLGKQAEVLNDIKAYWGGMLKEGATTFWEKYNPDESGTEHLSMYGRPYGKSLCHAWGASPLYLIGRYCLGVSPGRAGYERINISPVLGCLEWMDGAVPTPHGMVEVFMNREMLRVNILPCDARIVLKPEYEIETCSHHFERLPDGCQEIYIGKGEKLFVKLKNINKKLNYIRK